MERQGSSALITGASSGIGAAYADRLARRGWDLVLVARDVDRLEALSDRLRAETGVQVEVFVEDLSVKAGLAKVEQRLRSDPTIAMLVNNAGIASGGPFATANADDLEAVIQVNVLALTRLAAAAATAFVPRGSGVIINIGSTVSLMPEMCIAVYGATKAYVQYFSEALHHEIGASGVRVQVVLPGVVRTEFLDRAGVGMGHLQPSQIMEAGILVDAALAGFDQGERVTIACLPDPMDWVAVDQARLKLAPNLSKDRPAARYIGPDLPGS